MVHGTQIGMKGRADDMVLSRNDIEKIAEAELVSFTGGLVRGERSIRALPVEDFAMHHLGLRLIYTRLSNDGQTLGVTTYADTDISLNRYCRIDTIHVLKDTVLLDECMKDSQDWQHGEVGRRRFTVAHECAHQILYRREPENRRTELQQQYSARAFSLREMKSLDSWGEWQANAVAAALLMPKKYIALMLNGRRITYYGKRLNNPDRFIFDSMCYRFGVSKTAMKLRLRELGYLQFLSALDYYDPLDIICDDDSGGGPADGGMAYA